MIKLIYYIAALNLTSFFRPLCGSPFIEGSYPGTVRYVFHNSFGIKYFSGCSGTSSKLISSAFPYSKRIPKSLLIN